MTAPQHRIVPAPAAVVPTSGHGYELSAETVIYAPPTAAPVAGHLAALLRRATGFPLPIRSAPADTALAGLRLHLSDENELGHEGYRLESGERGVDISARDAAGLFYGVQTLRQLLPAAVESPTPQAGRWEVPPVRVTDAPRFAYRGAMLDVARHYFPPETVMRFVDRLAAYKINHLHLHLTDDQGWRLAIDGWPELARHGGRTQVGGGAGGYYRKQDYRELVAYAAARHITLVPEIDMPGHTNAALAAYPELTRDGVAPEPYTGMKVGFSTLYADKEITYRFVADVLGEVAALTPGPYLHIGGDEAFATTAGEYATFMARVQPMVAALGKTVMGWQEVVAVEYDGPRVLQQWRPEADPRLAGAAAAGDLLVLSPANRAYLDMRYDADSPLGLDWAGPIEVRDAYDWDPGSYLPGVPAEAVLGVEAPLWSETITTLDDIDYLAFPRLPALAEAGWSTMENRDWAGFGRRLAEHGPRWEAAGIRYHRSAQIAWPAGDS